MAKIKNRGFGIVVLAVVLGYKLYVHYNPSSPVSSTPEPVAYSAPGTPGLPVLSGGFEVIAHTAYTLSYNEVHEQANWVAYSLSSTDLAPSDIRRRDNFRTDPEVDDGSATLADYRRSGYDRGHLAPAADMKRSKEVMGESFFMSNMSPQLPALNRGIWKELEGLVRQWAQDCDSLYVVTGPVLEDGLETIGSNNVSIPRFYYKVLLDVKSPGLKAIGFVMANQRLDGEPFKYAVTVDSVEALTGIDFFANLQDEFENRIESQIDLEAWQ